MSKGTILVADDELAGALLLRQVLENRGYRVVSAARPAEILEGLRRERPILLVIDVQRPALEGLRVCEAIRRDPALASLPILALASRGAVADQAAAIQAGADDYVTKPFEPEEVEVRVTAMARERSPAARLHPVSRLPGLASLDRSLRERIEGERPFALLYVDLNGFRSFNEAFGHPRGDEVLRFLGSLLQEAAGRAGSGAAVGHSGGDDFALLASPERAERLAEELVQKFDEGIRRFYTPADLDRGGVDLTTRAGVRRQAPILSISIAVVTNERRRFQEVRKVWQVAQEVQRYAKARGGSVVFKDRRAERKSA